MGIFKNTIIQGNFEATDDIMDLNSELIGTNTVPTFDLSGVRIARGSETNALIAFDEIENVWKFGTDPNDGGTLQRIVGDNDMELFLDEGDNVTIIKNSSTGNTVVSAIPTGGDGEIQFASVNTSTGESIFDSSPNLVFTEQQLIINTRVSSRVSEVSSGLLNSNDDNKYIQYSLNQRTTDNTTESLYIDSSTTTNAPQVDSEGTWHFHGNIVARVVEVNSSITSTQKGESKAWKIEGVISNTGGFNARLVGNASIVVVASDSNLNSYDITVNVQNDGTLNIDVNGENGATVHWIGNVSIDSLIG